MIFTHYCVEKSVQNVEKKKAHPRAEMLKDGPLLSLKFEYLSKFQSSSNQAAIKKIPRSAYLCTRRGALGFGQIRGFCAAVAAK